MQNRQNIQKKQFPPELLFRGYSIYSGTMEDATSPDEICPLGRTGRDLSRKSLTSEQKKWIGYQISSRQLTARYLHENYNISLDNLYRYARKYEKGHSFYDNAGKPPLLGEFQKCEIVNFLRTSDYQVRTPEYNAKLQELAQDTARERNQAVSQVKTISPRTKKRIEDELGIKTGNAEATTNARALATADVRNAVSFAAMNTLMVPLSHPALILNVDGTQFTVGCDSKGKIQVKYVEAPNGPLKVLPQKSTESGVAYFIKYYLLMGAEGFTSDPVYILADNEMPEEEFAVYEVPGLHAHTGMCGKGYIVLCKTRCCNAAFYNWFNRSILIPFVEATRAHYDLQSDTLAWFQLDGEPKQMECYSKSELLDVLEEHNIAVGKPPASTTSTTQPCDVGNCFKAPKTSLKHINTAESPRNTHAVNRIEAVLKQHEDTYGHKLPYAHKKMAVEGLLKVQLALQNSMKRDMVCKSFAMCGIYPLSASQILNQCKTKIDTAEEERIMKSLDCLVERMKVQGELYEQDFDDFGIMTGTSGTKDKLVLYRRRSVILTNKQLYMREVEKRDKSKVAQLPKPKKNARPKKKIIELSPPAGISKLPRI